jgi:hypothetical protein
VEICRTLAAVNPARHRLALARDQEQECAMLSYLYGKKQLASTGKSC